MQAWTGGARQAVSRRRQADADPHSRLRPSDVISGAAAAGAWWRADVGEQRISGRRVSFADAGESNDAAAVDGSETGTVKRVRMREKRKREREAKRKLHEMCEKSSDMLLLYPPKYRIRDATQQAVTRQPVRHTDADEPVTAEQYRERGNLYERVAGLLRRNRQEPVRQRVQSGVQRGRVVGGEQLDTYERAAELLEKQELARVDDGVLLPSEGNVFDFAV
eukprot:TRINITY_DN4974_c1_g3_i6.p1 TRINITY_DN4974_c1_g3~~TRINITY_DN4974_c1_g3_i6.p1  ORF type:complete len:221 (+),score=28.48 TRINITY_DN4974_c1_g3_i6:46-708(+)